jgi:Mn2+/Fe2+ NRAMP family transporter
MEIFSKLNGGRQENNKKNRKRIQTTAQVATHNRTISFDRWLAVLAVLALAAGWMLMVVSPYASSSFRKHITATAATRAEIAQPDRMMMMAAIIIICLDRCCEPPLHDDRAHLLF